LKYLRVPPLSTASGSRCGDFPVRHHAEHRFEVTRLERIMGRLQPQRIAVIGKTAV